MIYWSVSMICFWTAQLKDCFIWPLKLCLLDLCAIFQWLKYNLLEKKGPLAFTSLVMLLTPDLLVEVWVLRHPARKFCCFCRSLFPWWNPWTITYAFRSFILVFLHITVLEDLLQDLLLWAASASLLKAAILYNLDLNTQFRK